VGSLLPALSIAHRAGIVCIVASDSIAVCVWNSPSVASGKPGRSADRGALQIAVPRETAGQAEPLCTVSPPGRLPVLGFVS